MEPPVRLRRKHSELYQQAIADGASLCTPPFAHHLSLATCPPFLLNSAEYLLASTHAATPPVVEQLLLRFRCTFDINLTPALRLGQPVTITTDRYGIGKEGHAVYAIIRAITEVLEPEDWPSTTMWVTVEAHAIPGYHTDWSQARPWVSPPYGAVFIQPHAFEEMNYIPLSLGSNEVIDILVPGYTLIEDNGASEHTYMGRTNLYQLPPSCVYPRQPLLVKHVRSTTPLLTVVKVEEDEVSGRVERVGDRDKPYGVRTAPSTSRTSLRSSRSVSSLTSLLPPFPFSSRKRSRVSSPSSSPPSYSLPSLSSPSPETSKRILGDIMTLLREEGITIPMTSEVVHARVEEKRIAD